ncbi:thioesterase domain-containing protein [Halovulum sp. GXIMD14794]
MAVIGLSLAEGVVRCDAAPESDLQAALAPRLRALPRNAPIVILIHGYKFSPNRVDADPNREIFSLSPANPCFRNTSWPAGLGFREGGVSDGLCLGFGWPAHDTDHSGPPLRRFARVYEAAARAGAALAGVIETIHDLAPDRPVDLLGHSLGARVALQAARHLRRGTLGQIILMGGAEYDGVALDCLAAPGARAAQVFNVTSRQNDLFDLLFTRFAPRPPGYHRPLSEGLGQHVRQAYDLPLDSEDLAPLLRRRGVHLGPDTRRICHWSFYTRPGVLGLYSEMLRNRHNWTISALKAEAGCLPQAARWSLLVPRLPWTPPDAGAGAVRPAAGA